MPASSWAGAMPDSPTVVEISLVPSVEEMAAYSAAVGFGLRPPQEPEASTPFLALSWLSRPAIRQLIAAACPAGSLPMQVSQTIEMGDIMTVGDVLVVTASLDARNDPVHLNYAVTDSAGTVRTSGQIGFVWIAAADIGQLLS